MKTHKVCFEFATLRGLILANKLHAIATKLIITFITLNAVTL